MKKGAGLFAGKGLAVSLGASVTLHGALFLYKPPPIQAVAYSEKPALYWRLVHPPKESAQAVPVHSAHQTLSQELTQQSIHVPLQPVVQTPKVLKVSKPKSSVKVQRPKVMTHVCPQVKTAKKSAKISPVLPSLSGASSSSCPSVCQAPIRYRHKVLAVYPKRCRIRHETGSVVVRYYIHPSGRVLSTQVNCSSGYHRLDKAALKAAQASRVLPFDGKQARFQDQIYHFNLAQ
jgi:TonB family protein